MIGFPTTGNTKIPPCGAISVQPNSSEHRPAAAEPITQLGMKGQLLRKGLHLL